MNYKLNRTLLLRKLLDLVNNKKKILFDELVDNLSDDTIFKRRLRMIQQLSHYESQIVEKIRNFKTDDPSDIDSVATVIKYEIETVANRSA